MVARAREDLLAAGLAVFDRDGFEGATVAAIRTRARASNGSFFHLFESKKELAEKVIAGRSEDWLGELDMEALRAAVALAPDALEEEAA